MAVSKKKIHADDGFNPELVQGARFEGALQLPCIERPEKIVVPDYIIPLSRAKGDCDKTAFVAEYEYESNFGLLVKNPREFVEKIRPYGGFIATDNSVYLDSPVYSQIGNLSRSRIMGYYMQSNGIYTIGNYRGGSKELYTTELFNTPPSVMGLPRGSILSVSPYGCIRNAESKYHFEASLHTMLDYLCPKVVLVYSHGADGILRGLRHRTQFVVYNDWITVKHGGERNGIWL
jgi:hypothetical protein